MDPSPDNLDLRPKSIEPGTDPTSARYFHATVWPENAELIKADTSSILRNSIATMHTCTTVLAELRACASALSGLAGQPDNSLGAQEGINDMETFNRRLGLVEETNKKLKENLVEVQAWIEGMEKNQEWMAWVTEKLGSLEQEKDQNEFRMKGQKQAMLEDTK